MRMILKDYYEELESKFNHYIATDSENELWYSAATRIAESTMDKMAEIEDIAADYGWECTIEIGISKITLVDF